MELGQVLSKGCPWQGESWPNLEPHTHTHSTAAQTWIKPIGLLLLRRTRQGSRLQREPPSVRVLMEEVSINHLSQGQGCTGWGTAVGSTVWFYIAQVFANKFIIFFLASKNVFFTLYKKYRGWLLLDHCSVSPLRRQYRELPWTTHPVAPIISILY